MNVFELIALLERVKDKSQKVCQPPPADDTGPDAWLRDDQEVSGTSRWVRPHLTSDGRALVDGPYIRLDADPY